MANTFKKVWRDKKFRMHAVWQPSGAVGPKLVRYPEKSFKMRETLLLFHSKLKTVRLKVFAELVIHCHPSDAAPHSEKAGLIPGAPKCHIQSRGDNKEHLFFITFLPFSFILTTSGTHLTTGCVTQNTLLFSQCIAAVCLPKYVVVMLQNFTHFVSAMAAIVNLAPISDLLPILDIDGLL